MKYHTEAGKALGGETIADGLGVPNRTAEELSAMAHLMELVFERKMNNSDAILEVMKIYNITDTPEIRKCACEIFAFSGSLEFAKFMKAMG
jgi:hypothetical protein